MNLFDLVLFLTILVAIFMFWRFRAMAEKANLHIIDYCERQNLQLLSVARRTTKLSSYKGKLDLQSEFSFEFSGNGEDSYVGILTMAGLNIIDLYTPAYRVN